MLKVVAANVGPDCRTGDESRSVPGAAGRGLLPAGVDGKRDE